MFVLPRYISPRAAVPAFSRSLERQLEEAGERQSGPTTHEAPVRTPAMDVTESDTHYTVTFDMQGVSREQLKVSIEAPRVSVDTVAATPVGTTTADSPPSAVPEARRATRVFYREPSAARCAPTVRLPAEVVPSTSQAKLDNGVLTLTLAKRVASGATQLHISRAPSA